MTKKFQYNIIYIEKLNVLFIELIYCFIFQRKKKQNLKKFLCV